MKKNVYICSAELVEIDTTDTYRRRNKALFPILESISSQFCKTTRGNALFVYITKIYDRMQNWVKFGFAANNSNRVRFYGKTVIDGKAITSKKYNDALSAMEWGERQINRECTAIYCITAGGEHLPVNVQFI